MSLCETITRKLQQATCDKIALNRRILHWHQCLKEAAKALDGKPHTGKDAKSK